MLPLYFILIPFALFTAGVLLYGALTTLALWRLGGEFNAFLATFIFWAGSAAVIFFAYAALQNVDWNQPLLNYSVFTPSGF